MFGDLKTRRTEIVTMFNAHLNRQVGRASRTSDSGGRRSSWF
jgi:hypothetical protein